MASGRCKRPAELPADILDVLTTARRAVMTTVDAEGRPHAVPVVYALDGDNIVTPIDRKPKTGKRLGRLANLDANPHVALLADRWTEDWTRLAWVMVRGRGELRPATQSAAEVEAIIARYHEYRDTLVDSDVIEIVPESILWWRWS